MSKQTMKSQGPVGLAVFISSKLDRPGVDHPTFIKWVEDTPDSAELLRVAVQLGSPEELWVDDICRVTERELDCLLADLQRSRIGPVLSHWYEKDDLADDFIRVRGLDRDGPEFDTRQHIEAWKMLVDAHRRAKQLLAYGELAEKMYGEFAAEPKKVRAPAARKKHGKKSKSVSPALTSRSNRRLAMA